MKPSERYDGLRPLCLVKQLFVLNICWIHFHCMKNIPESLRPVRAENSSMFVHTELLFVYIILISLPLNFILFDFLETFQINQYQYLNSLISTLIHVLDCQRWIFIQQEPKCVYYTYDDIFYACVLLEL